MIKNVALKIFLQDYIFSILSWINVRIKHDENKIMFYSNMGFRDNVKSLYDYIIEEKYNEKYTIVCSINDYKRFSQVKIKNVKFVSNFRGIFEYFTSGCVFYCFGKLPIFHAKDQKVVQMWHGSPFKNPDDGMLKGHSFDKPYYSNVVVAGKHLAPIFSYCFSIPEEQITICGYPRCDALFKENPNYDFGKYDKIILWAPTFRKSTVTGYSDSSTADEYIVPVLKYSDFHEINEALKNLNVKVVVKLHPLQDLSNYEVTNLDYFQLLSHAEFIKRDMDLYRFMSQCDALITDYSSIFYDYLLLNRPIGFTEDDMDDYSRGYVWESPKSYQPGCRIKTKADFIRFVEDVAMGADGYQSERNRVLDLSNDYKDGGYCQKILTLFSITRF